MDKINWSNSTGDDFTLFCNALLSFELGKSYQPFSAAGKDGGIDGAFDGAYSGKTGKWRFQYKFRSGPRAQSFSGLKSTVKTELTSLNDEAVYVLLTNVELLPQETVELQQILQTEVTILGKTCECMVWDGAKLFSLYLQYPLLQLWMQDGFQTAQLQDYHTAFKKELSKAGFLPGTLANTFFARVNDLKGLGDFLLNDTPMALVTGEAGIGKTRLVLEFFSNQVDPDPQWTPLVLLNRNVDFDKVRRALAGAGNYVVLIDDAHSYVPEIIADIQRISSTASNKIKLILTARNLEAFRSLSLLKEYEKANILHLNLSELSRPETAQMFDHYVDNHQHYRNFIPQLVEISYGKPILIIAILNAINDGIPIARIREADFVRDYVTNYFNSYYNAVVMLTGWSKLQAKRFLQQVVLIEPFNYGDTNIVQKLTDIQGLQANDGVAALKLLMENDLVDGRYLQSIKPDYYSDILLSDIDRVEVAGYISEFIQFLDNIVVNLSSVDESNRTQHNLLNDILTDYVSFIKDTDQIAIVDRVLGTILNIAGYQPRIAEKAVEFYLDALKNEQHVIYQEWQELNARPGYSTFTALSKVIELLSYLSGLPEYYDFSFRKSMHFFLLTGDAKVVGLFAFSRKDVIEQFKFPRQLFFLQELSRKLKKLTPQEINFGLQVMKSWLNLEFMVTGSSAVNRFELNITTYYLPASAPIKKLRKQIAELLVKIYRDPAMNGHRLETLKDLLDIPRSIFATSKNPKPYQNNEEIKIVLNFLEREAAQFDLKEKKEIEEKLFWFRRWGIPAEFHQQLDTIKLKLQPKNLTEQLSQVFSKAEVSFSDINMVETKITTACDNLVNQFDAATMADSIIEFLESEQYPPVYFFAFLNRLIEHYPEYAKILYRRMDETAPKLFAGYGADILGGAYYVFKDHNFYWQEVAALQKADTAETDNMLLSVYGRRVPGNTQIGPEDVSVILKVFHKKRKENNFNLASSIQSLIAAKYDKVLDICIGFLKRAHQKEAEMFFIWLSDNKVATYDLLSELVINHTTRFYLTYEFERCLNKVLRTSGQDVVFDYLCVRYEYKKAIVINQKTLSGYEFVPDGDHSHLFDGIPEQKAAMFIKAMEWYLTVDSEGGHLFYAKNMLEYLKPAKAIDQESLVWYQEKIEQLDDQATGLDRIIDSLSIFHVKDDGLLDLVISGFTAAHDLHETHQDYYKIIRQESYSAVTMMGVKSGAVGEPFQVDVDLQNLLKFKIGSLPEYLPATVFLKEVLKSVEADIDRSSGRDNLRW
ncbi:ATP-binding protein [Mucilaginibacter dorajii]|uniref:AAA+ ATPase domain-containing protein n=1 Tax=Mucilaginibacter dorajii TaxID=692994 RepID=A0ABP7QAK0_9SPHI|nr:ATP-binding protein [Mucilaginibacter dorajii]MCS3737137.1 hypothetical protein [Mucilaginibacter dorajii]